MECTRLKTGIFVGTRETNYPDWIWMVATQLAYIPFGVDLSVKLKKIDSYWRHVNTALPENTKYNTQFCDDPNKQHFMWGNSSQLKS